MESARQPAFGMRIIFFVTYSFDSTTSGNASGSVCPKGWTLPSSSEYGKLSAIIYGLGSGTPSTGGFAKAQQAPLDFYLTGYYNYNNSGSISEEAYSAFYWSSTASSNTFSRYYCINKEFIAAGDYSRGNGYAIRCVGTR